nr:uncharacterized protein LOC107436999 [Parasteatoda tepidariorum]
MDTYTPEECYFLAAYAKGNTFFKHHICVLNHIYRSLLMYNDLICLHHILDISKETKLDFWSLFSRKLPHNQIDFSHASLLGNPKIFVSITICGAINKYHHGLFMECVEIKPYIFLKREDSIFYRKMSSCLSEKKVSRCPVNFRCSQIISIFGRRQCLYPLIIELSLADFDVALQVLWRSIPDPLLTKEEFFRIFSGLDFMDSNDVQEANRIWGWYTHLLVGGIEIATKCPRSLCHLSRCAIRGRLKECFALPYGVHLLDIPKQLKQYLLLNDECQFSM